MEVWRDGSQVHVVKQSGQTSPFPEINNFLGVPNHPYICRVLLHNQFFWTLWIATKQKRREDDKIKRIHPGKKKKKKRERKGSGLGMTLRKTLFSSASSLPSSSFPHNVHCPDFPSLHFQE
jgi:hypothetical protein